MSYTSISWALKVKGISPGAKLILALLAECENEKTGACFPGQKSLSEDSGFDTRTIGRHLQALEDANLIQRKRRYREGGFRTSDEYILNRTLSEKMSPKGEGSLPDNFADLTRQNRQTLPDKMSEQEPRSINQEVNQEDSCDGTAGSQGSLQLSLTPPAINLTSDGQEFAEFWKAYPRKVGKPKALLAYRAATKRTTPSEILDGLANHVPAWLAGDPNFVPHPTTWLNRDGWADQVTPPRQTDADRRRANTERRRNSWARLIAEGGSGEGSPDFDRGASLRAPESSRGSWAQFHQGESAADTYSECDDPSVLEGTAIEVHHEDGD